MMRSDSAASLAQIPDNIDKGSKSNEVDEKAKSKAGGEEPQVPLSFEELQQKMGDDRWGSSGSHRNDVGVVPNLHPGRVEAKRDIMKEKSDEAFPKRDIMKEKSDEASPN